jgi:ABC-type polysaccharide/polyol phosphate transport system ATPase subunit
VVQVRLADVSFRYPVFDITARSFKILAMRLFGGNPRAGVVEVQALSNVSLEFSPGDRIGLIGRNGAGKSTLLRLLAGLIHPQSGSAKIKGRVVPLIARGLGIHPELTGYQNIELPMRLLGAKEAEIKRAQQEVPEWSGLGHFINLPVRTYSDGMRARLLFAICTAVRGDILIMDEWLSAGDAEFVSKAQVRLNEVLNEARIVVLASHSIDIIQKICNKVCWMERGEVVMIGAPNIVLPIYLLGAQGAPSTEDQRIVAH